MWPWSGSGLLHRPWRSQCVHFIAESVDHTLVALHLSLAPSVPLPLSLLFPLIWICFNIHHFSQTYTISHFLQTYTISHSLRNWGINYLIWFALGASSNWTIMSFPLRKKPPKIKKIHKNTKKYKIEQSQLVSEDHPHSQTWPCLLICRSDERRCWAILEAQINFGYVNP